MCFLSCCCSPPLMFSSSSSTSSSRPQLFSSPVPTWPTPGAGNTGEAALLCLVRESQSNHRSHAFASRSEPGYVSHGTSAFWMISLAVSVTCDRSTDVSSIFSAVIRPWGNDAAKPHLSPAFLEHVQLEISWLSCVSVQAHACCCWANYLAVLSFSRALLTSSVISDTLTLAILLHLITLNANEKGSVW